MKMILTRISFRRIILTIEGRFEDGPAPEPSQVRFFLRDASGKTLDAEPEEVFLDGASFCVRMNVMALSDEYPIESGTWYFMSKVQGEDRPLPAAVTEEVREAIGSESSIQKMTGKLTVDEFVAYTDREVHRSSAENTRATGLEIQKTTGEYWKGHSGLDDKGHYYLSVSFHANKTKMAEYIRDPRLLVHKIVRLIPDTGFQVFFRLCRLFPGRKKNKVLFSSSRYNHLTGNEKFLHDRMVERGLDKKYEICYNFKDGVASHRGIKEKFRFTYHLATASYIIVDDYSPEIYRLKYGSDVKVVQLWHACGALKTIGFERLDKQGSPAFRTKVHKCYTHVTVSSDLSAEHNAEAFAIRRSKFYPVGIARTDVFFDQDYIRSVQQKLRETYPAITKASEVVLYAPTFRGNNGYTAFFPYEMIDLASLGAWLKETGRIMLIKMHPFVKDAAPIPEEYREQFLDVTSYPDINELLMVTDLLITDYSSVIYEASLLRIPMLFFAFDYDLYDGDRGFYEPYEDIVPGKIVKSSEELLTALRSGDYEAEKLEGFLKRNFTYLDGHATDRTIDLIFGK